jgi:alpha-L-rhamnosidase
LRPTHLRTEYLENPIGIGETSPRLSWWCESNTRGDLQKSYQILVATSPEKLKKNQGDLWNSGKVKSDASTQIEYSGLPMSSRDRAWWKVRVWDKAEKPSEFSKPAIWEIGLLKKSDWIGKWVGMPSARTRKVTLHDRNWIWFPEGKPEIDAPLQSRFFRTSFDLSKTALITDASLWGIVDDEATIYLNGKKIADIHGFKTVTVLPLKQFLKKGRNVLAVKAWNTGGPAALSMLVDLTHSNGTTQTLAPSDTGWLTSNQVKAGWQNSSFNASSWKRAIIVGSVGKGAWPEPRQDIPLDKAIYIRQEFYAPFKVSQARIYVSAKGVYELYLDGKRIGNDVFAPGWTDYHKRIQYQTYDVTELLKSGHHTIGAVLGDGWYVGSVGWGGRGQYGDKPMALVQLEMFDRTGFMRATCATDETWQISSGPILSSDIMLGESYDARNEDSGWCKPVSKSKRWKKVSVESIGAVPLVWQPDQSVEKWDEIAAKQITEPKKGVFVFDLGQNMVGWARLSVRGPRGKKVQLRFAEVLNPDGTIYTTNLRGAKSTDTYILKGGGQEVYEPSFTFHGFRYVEVTGYPGKPTKGAIKGIVVGSALPTTLSFECSNKMVNQLQHNIYWGMRGNYLSVPTDCPQRDERLGWMGDAQIFAPTAAYNCDVAPFMTKWLQDVRDGQSPAGGFADVSPRVLMSGDAAPAWGDAGVIVPWSIYQAYGDKRLLARNYPAMKQWVEYIFQSNRNLLWLNNRGNDYGDWLSIQADTPKDVLATAFFARSTDLVARSAEVLGKTTDARKYRAIFDGIKQEFNKNYVAADGRIKGDTQTCYALALAFNLVPDDKRSTIAKYMADDIEHKHNGHLSTGFVGVKYLAPALADSGRLDLAYKLLLNETFPGWMYSIKQGATTIWERWDGYTKEKGFQDPGMNSFNHYSFGSIGEWMYSTIGGLQMTSPGWKTFRVHPQPGGGITWAKTGFDSPHGHIQCDWKYGDKDYKLDLTVPVGTVAEVYLPNYYSFWYEGRIEARQTSAVRLIRKEGNPDVFRVGAGSYHFRCVQELE